MKPHEQDQLDAATAEVTAGAMHAASSLGLPLLKEGAPTTGTAGAVVTERIADMIRAGALRLCNHMTPSPRPCTVFLSLGLMMCDDCVRANFQELTHAIKATDDGLCDLCQQPYGSSGYPSVVILGPVRVQVFHCDACKTSLERKIRG